MNRSVLGLGIILIITACSSSENTSYSIDPTRRYEVSEQREGTDSDQESVDRKIIYNANYEIAVRNRDSANVHISKLVTQCGGYILEAGTYSTIIRVPTIKYDSCLTNLDNIGKIISVKKSAKDVTDEYYDSELRLENLKKARDRYLEILKQANTVKDILEIEKELNRTNTEIESFAGKLNRLKHLVSYSTITIKWQDLFHLGPFGYIGYYSYKAISWLFVW